MVYLMATVSPDLITGGVAAAGWLPKAFWRPAIAPLIASHGTEDATVAYMPTLEYWEFLTNAGAPIVSEAFNQGHEAGGQIYAHMTNGARFFLNKVTLANA
jgi:predicted esterase